MNYSEFEKLLGKPISFAESCVGDEFTDEPFQNGTYFLEDESSYKSFYGSKYNALSIQKDDLKIVHTITVHLLEVLNSNTLNFLKKQYGEPDHIWVIDKTTIISESIDDSNQELTQHLTKAEHDLREGTFDEKPLFIIWNKKGFELKVLFRYEQNLSQVSFRQIH